MYPGTTQSLTENTLLQHGRIAGTPDPYRAGLPATPLSPAAPERFAPTDGHGGIVGTPRSKAGEGSLARENRDAGSARERHGSWHPAGG